MCVCLCVYCMFVCVCVFCFIVLVVEDWNNIICIVDIVSMYSKYYYKLWVFLKKNRIYDWIIKFLSYY